MSTKINIGLLGCGRLGKVYARDLAGLIPETRLTAVADADPDAARRCADDFAVPGCYSHPLDLLDDPKVDAAVIVTPTSTHADLVEACAARGKPVFCEKPLSIDLDQAIKMQNVVEESGIFFQMGFMRRFDPGYAAAKEKIESGEIGRPVVFKSTSRDPYRPSVEYADPRHSGGMLVDMGIHDFDLALWLMGPVRAVHSTGGVLVYPELGEVGDIDNAIVTLEFEQGVGVVDLTRKGVYAYEVSTEVLGSEGAVRVGYLRQTPLLVLKENRVSHDTVPYFPQRFRDAYTLQLQDFARNLSSGTPPPITIADGVQALKVARAATQSLHSGQKVRL
ncbi:MAG TPA: Gfo/Idh/MocA family oxidoreductase [Acidobacteriota bacterium]|nr:Gfo/Idh/MocA family oxidoreductase [Acidobacteriota bacterium]